MFSERPTGPWKVHAPPDYCVMPHGFEVVAKGVERPTDQNSVYRKELNELTPAGPYPTTTSHEAPASFKRLTVDLSLYIAYMTIARFAARDGIAPCTDGTGAVSGQRMGKCSQSRSAARLLETGHVPRDCDCELLS